MYQFRCQLKMSFIQIEIHTNRIDTPSKHKRKNGYKSEKENERRRKQNQNKTGQLFCTYKKNPNYYLTLC